MYLFDYNLNKDNLFFHPLSIRKVEANDSLSYYRFILLYYSKKNVKVVNK